MKKKGYRKKKDNEGLIPNTLFVLAREYLFNKKIKL